MKDLKNKMDIAHVEYMKGSYSDIGLTGLAVLGKGYIDALREYEDEFKVMLRKVDNEKS